jgi:hypothetical protein
VSPSPTQEPTTAAPTTATPADEPAAGKTSAEPAAADTKDDDGMPMSVPLGIGAAVLVLGGGAWWLRSRRGGSA